jgi:hypothetical protein
MVYYIQVIAVEIILLSEEREA